MNHLRYEGDCSENLITHSVRFYVCKLCKPFHFDIITYTFNLGLVPSAWKTARVIACKVVHDTRFAAPKHENVTIKEYDNIHSKLYLMKNDQGKIVDAYIGSYNFNTPGRFKDIIYKVRKNDYRNMHEYFESLWRQ